MEPVDAEVLCIEEKAFSGVIIRDPVGTDLF
jgi:hypothetical protein